MQKTISTLAEDYLAGLNAPRFSQGFSRGWFSKNLPSGTNLLTEESIIAQLDALRDSMLSDMPDSVGAALDLQRNLWGEPENCAVDRQYFEELKSITLPGRDDLGTIRMIGGLTATGSPWLKFAQAVNAASGIKIQIDSLDGHDGDWNHYRNAKKSRWVEQMLDTIKPGDIACLLSTSGNAYCEALSIRQDLGCACIGIGWPIFLRNRNNEVLIERIRRYSGPLKYFLKFVSTQYPRNDDDSQEPCPQFVRMPVSVAIQLRESQLGALRAIFSTLAKNKHAFNFPPLFYAQGENDLPVHPCVRDFIAADPGFIRSPLKVVPPLYEGANHTVQTGPSMQQLLRDVGKFLRQVYLLRGVHPTEIPAFNF